MKAWLEQGAAAKPKPVEALGGKHMAEEERENKNGDRLYRVTVLAGGALLGVVLLISGTVHIGVSAPLIGISLYHLFKELSS